MRFRLPAWCFLLATSALSWRRRLATSHRNGMPFENRIREKERNNPKFSFLDPTDAYHEYYTWRL